MVMALCYLLSYKTGPIIFYSIRKSGLVQDVSPYKILNNMLTNYLEVLIINVGKMLGSRSQISRFCRK